MADFCWQCTARLFGPEHAQANDLAASIDHLSKAPTWLLCEGCGIHAFTPDGRRLHDVEHGVISWAPCDQCQALCIIVDPDWHPRT